MNSFETKYKDRKPEETIKIITDFFESRGYELYYRYHRNDNLSVISCGIELKLQGQDIMHSNGKGLDELYCLASGLGEMYERFCNKVPFYLTPSINHILMKKNYDDYNYYLHPNEKIITYEDAKLEPLINQYLISFTSENEEDQRELYNILCDYNSIGIPYYNIENSQDVKYLDPRILIRLNRSTGCAAGNSFKEAFNQGLSEYFERYCGNEFYKNKEKNFYQIPTNEIQNEKLKNIIKDIEKNFKLIILDLSYNFQLPVILVLAVDKINHNIAQSFGSFPIFDIALERCLTELYQGIEVNGFHKHLSIKYQQPYNSNKWDEHFFAPGLNYKDYPFLPENIFLNLIQVENPSLTFIKNKNATNEEIFEYYKNLCKKMNFDIYYTDNSLIDEISSVHIYCANKISHDCLYDLGSQFKLDVKKSVIKDLKLRLNIVKGAITNNYDLEEYSKGIDNMCEVKSLENLERYLGELIGGDWITPYPSNIDLTFFYIDLIHSKRYDIIKQYSRKTTYLHSYFRKISYLEDFSQYFLSSESIEKFLQINNILDFDITEEEIKNFYDFKYTLEHYILIPLNKEFNSERYKIFIKSLQR